MIFGAEESFIEVDQHGEVALRVPADFDYHDEADVAAVTLASNLWKEVSMSGRGGTAWVDRLLSVNNQPEAVADDQGLHEEGSAQGAA